MLMSDLLALACQYKFIYRINVKPLMRCVTKTSEIVACQLLAIIVIRPIHASNKDNN